MFPHRVEEELSFPVRSFRQRVLVRSVEVSLGHAYKSSLLFCGGWTSYFSHQETHNYSIQQPERRLRQMCLQAFQPGKKKIAQGLSLIVITVSIGCKRSPSKGKKNTDARRLKHNRVGHGDVMWRSVCWFANGGVIGVFEVEETQANTLTTHHIPKQG